MAEKFHHKLYTMNEYLKKDLALAHKQADSSADVTNVAVKELGNTLQDMNKARKMRRLINSIRDYYQNTSKEYSLKVAVFVSRHKVLDKADYVKLNKSLANFD